MEEKTDLEAALEGIDEIVTNLEEAAACGPALGRAAEKRARLTASAYASALETRHRVRAAIATSRVERELASPEAQLR